MATNEGAERAAAREAKELAAGDGEEGADKARARVHIRAEPIGCEGAAKPIAVFVEGVLRGGRRREHAVPAAHIEHTRP